jgi:hypothetical protein
LLYILPVISGTARRKSEKGEDKNSSAGTAAPAKRGPGRPPGPAKTNEAGLKSSLEPPVKRAKTDPGSGPPPAAGNNNGLANGFPLNQAVAPHQQQQQHQLQQLPQQQQQLPQQQQLAPPPPGPQQQQQQQQQRPNPLKWNVSEVCDFVKALPGCAEYVEEFAAQEIDGQALMLLKADHLMSAMSIKLGPALKICSHIEQIREELNRN